MGKGCTGPVTGGDTMGDMGGGDSTGVGAGAGRVGSSAMGGAAHPATHSVVAHSNVDVIFMRRTLCACVLVNSRNRNSKRTGFIARHDFFTNPVYCGA
jgi:hypothetical protein